MSPRILVVIALFVLSEAAGIAIGEWFYRLFVSAIPPVGQSQFTAQASHVAHIGYGAAVGVALFAWALLGMVIARVHGGRAKPEPVPKA